MSCSKSLEFEAIRRAIKYRKLQKYHAAFVGAEYNQYFGFAANQPYKTEKELNKLLDTRLKKKLLSLGKLAHKRKGNYLGNCAEVHASDKVLKQHYKIRVDQISFTKAYRCRTMQIIPYCFNCLDTFNLKNP